MKKIFYLIGLLLILMTLKPFSCTVNLTTGWTVSGTTIFNGTPDAGTTLKLAAFFTGEDTVITEHSILVSNVVTATDGGAFSLDINASELKPGEHDSIYLKMWYDVDLDDLRDSGEGQKTLEPAPGGCPVFGDARERDFVDLNVGSCSFVWYDEGGGCILHLYDEGWNVETSWLVAESVDTAVLTGARITNRYSF